MVLPNVLDYLSRKQTLRANLIKPAVGEELEILFEKELAALLKAEILSIRLMTLQPNHVTPFHVHQKKEKCYLVRGPGILTVGVIDKNNRFYTHDLCSGDLFVIPPRTPHFVMFFPDKPMICQTVVISSSRDSSDILWQDGADGL